MAIAKYQAVLVSLGYKLSSSNLATAVRVRADGPAGRLEVAALTDYAARYGSEVSEAHVVTQLENAAGADAPRAVVVIVDGAG